MSLWRTFQIQTTMTLLIYVTKLWFSLQVTIKTAVGKSMAWDAGEDAQTMEQWHPNLFFLRGNSSKSWHCTLLACGHWYCYTESCSCLKSACMCLSMCEKCVYMCIGLWRPEINSECLSLSPSTSSCEKGTWNLLFKLDLLVNKARVTGMHHHPWLFMCILTSQTRVFLLLQQELFQLRHLHRPLCIFFRQNEGENYDLFYVLPLEFFFFFGAVK